MSHLMTALAMRAKGLKPATKIVLYWLADHHNSETGRCFPSMATLAEECEMNRSTVQAHLARLEEMGLIQRTNRTRENGSKASNEYTLVLLDGGISAIGGRKIRHAHGGNSAMPNLGSSNLGTPLGSACSGDLFGEVDPPPDSAAKMHLPENWLPTENDLAYAREKGLNESEIKEMTDEFRGYWAERRDAKAKRSVGGWARTWQGWVRREAPTYIRNRRVADGPRSGGGRQNVSFADIIGKRDSDGD